MQNKQDYRTQLIVSLTRHKISTPTPKLIILVGLPYAGKSTFSVEMERHGFVHIWTTKIRKELGYTDKEVLDFIVVLLRELIAGGYSVIIDFLNHKKKYRDRFFGVARELGADTELAYFDIPYEEILRRMEHTFHSGGGPGRSLLSRGVIDEIAAEFE